jgi:beta-galactosidase/beta-glucuronidase
MSTLTRLIAFFFIWAPALADDAKVPWPEHPRPDFQRSAWVNLNGPWRFAFDPKDVGEKEGWQQGEHRLDRKIVVPFPWESKLSGIADTEYKGVAWYQREVQIPRRRGLGGQGPVADCRRLRF